MEEHLDVLMDPWHDKFNRLLEAHEKLRKLNQTLEEKLLKLAENNHHESQRLTFQAQELTQRLVDARVYIHQLQDENDRYRNDINLVVQLLHCNPSNFVSPKLEALPDDLQRKVLSIRNGSNCKKEKKIIKVQVPTFPPTDIMYSVDKGKGKKNGEKDIVSAAIMAKILQERENERNESRQNRCICASKIVLPLVDTDAQTMPVCTISYSDFHYSDFDEEDDDDEEEEEDEDAIVEEDEDDEEEEEIIYEKKTSDVAFKSDKEPLIGTPCAPNRNVTIDDIMKTDTKEEELLPTPIFLRRCKDTFMKHESQDSTYSTGSSNCNTTTNSSNSNISHSSRMSVGIFEEETAFNGRCHPSPTSMSHSISSASPDIQIGRLPSHFLEDFDHDAITGGLNTYYGQSFGLVQTPGQIVEEGRNGCSSQSNTPSSQDVFNFENIPVVVAKKSAQRPQSMNPNFTSNSKGGWEGHWRSTVLVHHPPKSHSYEPLSLTSTVHNTSTFSSSAMCNNELLPDSPSHSPSYHTVRVSKTGGSTILGDGSRSREGISHQSAQPYRTPHKPFWTRTGSKSIETEI